MLIDHRNLGPVGDQLGDGGQATVHTLPGQDWRYKRYKPEAVIDSAQLDALIALPHKADAVDRDLFATATCWPQARVVDGSRTCGVLLPAIDPAFQCRLALGEGDLRLRTLDYLVRGELAAGYGLPDPALGERLAFAVRLARIAELFARHDVVYGDWSYDNTLWAPAGAVLMIDCDAATIGAVSTPRVETTAWEEPLTPAGATVDEFTDRYRLGLMIWRILERSPRHPTGPPWLPSAPKPVAAELDQLVAATFAVNDPAARQRRPRPDTWLAALQRAHTAAAVENRTGPGP